MSADRACVQTDMSKYVKLERNGNTFYHVRCPSPSPFAKHATGSPLLKTKS